jgi:hypothetical protein
MGIQPSSVTSPCAIGIDVKPNSYDCCIGQVVKPAHDVDIAQIVFYGKVRDEKDVIWLANQYPVRCGVADCRPESTIIARMIEKLRKQRKEFWRAQYSPNSAAIEMTLNEKERLVTLHRTMALDNVFFRASTATGLALPQNFREICSGQFMSEMCNSTRVPVIERGEEAWRWTSGSDHSHHAMSYMLVAMKIGRLAMGASNLITTVPGAVSGSIAANISDEDDVDPFEDKGSGNALVFEDDAGFGL